jgi:opacity protein-like surface antigen
MAIIAIALSTAFSATAQKGDMAVGGNLIFGTGNSYSHAGLGAKFYYNVTNPIRLAGEFDYFFKSNNIINWWDFSVYGHYLFDITDKVNFYPLAGLGILGIHTEFELFDNSQYLLHLVATLGAGVDYKLTDKLSLNFESRLKFYENTRSNFALGIAYKLNNR